MGRDGLGRTYRPALEMLESRLLLATYSVPLTIPYDYGTDVTSQLQSFINTVPNNSVIEFPVLAYDAGAVGYKIEGTLTISGKSGLTVEGNGAYFRAFDPIADGAPNQRTRYQWQVTGTSTTNITLLNMVVYGANTGHIYDAAREAQHAFNVVGGANGVLIDNVHIYETYGDGVYIGGSSATSNVTVQNSHIQYTGRQGMAPCQGSNILIQNNWIGDSSRGLIDIEPYAAGWLVDNVRIIGNTFGNSRLLTFPMGGGGDYGTVMIANNVAMGNNGVPKIYYTRGDASSRRGPFIVVNNQFNVGGSPAAAIRLQPVDGAFIAGNYLALPATRAMTAVELRNSRGAVIGDNVFNGAATGVDADAISTPLWQFDNPLSGGASSQTTLTELPGNPGCYYSTVPYPDGGQVIAIWRAVNGTGTYSYGGLTTSGDYAVVRVDAGGAFVDGFGFNGTSSYNGVDLAWLKPNAPSGLTATTASSSQINLSWTDNMANESGFRIERAPDAGGAAGAWARIATVGASVTTYQDSTGLVPGATYYYRVETYNAISDSAYSNVANAAPTNIIPAAPTVLTATAVLDGRINLAWTDNANNETGFRIERSPNGSSSWAEIGTVGANVTTYANTGLTANTTYYYRVRAYNPVGNSSYSNTASAVTGDPTIPPSPTSLSAATLSPSDVWLAWTDRADNETGFRIERAADAGGVPGAWTEVGTVGRDVVAYGCTGLSANTTYYFRVRAYNGAGNSAYSNTASATTMQVSFSESWTGGNGSAWPAVWTFEGGALTTRDIQGNTGHIYSSGGASARAYYNAGSYTDSMQLVSLEGTLNGPKFGLIARRADSDGDTYYQFSTDMIGTYTSSNKVYVYKVVDGTATALATVTLGYNVEHNVWWKMRFQVQQNGSTTALKARIWKVSDPEPTAWTISISDGTAVLQNRSGRGGLSLNPSSNRSLYADNYSVTNLDPPAAPSGLTATAFSAGRVDVSWTDNSTNEAGFRIERSPNGATGWTQVTVVGAGVTSWSDLGVGPATTYYYRVQAYHAAANSAYSASASATTPDVAPAAPSGLTATAVSGSRINLGWADNSGNEDGFLIERSPDGIADWAGIASLGPNAVSYGNTDLSESTAYFYRVQAYNGVGASAYSGVASAVTADATPPTVTGVAINLGAAQRSMIRVLDVQFSEAVNVAKGDLTLYDYSLGGAVDLSAATFSYDAGAHKATWDLTAVALNDAYFDATVQTTVTDAAGNPLAAPSVSQFFKLAGDANGDGSADVGDLGILGANYGTSGNWWALPGDMNADGVVDVGDLGILGANYGTTLTPPGGGAAGPAVAQPAAHAPAVLAPAAEPLTVSAPAAEAAAASLAPASGALGATAALPDPVDYATVISSPRGEPSDPQDMDVLAVAKSVL